MFAFDCSVSHITSFDQYVVFYTHTLKNAHPSFKFHNTLAMIRSLVYIVSTIDSDINDTQTVAFLISFSK